MTTKNRNEKNKKAPKHKQSREEATGNTAGFGSPNTGSAGKGPRTLSGTRLSTEYMNGGSKSFRKD